MAGRPGEKVGIVKYTKEQYALALDTYILYGEQGIRGAGRAASEISGIPIDSIKQEAKKRGISIANKKSLEKHRASMMESRRQYIRARLLDIIDETINRMTSEYKVPIKTVNRYESFGEDVTAVEQEVYVHDRPPAREFEKFASALEKLVDIFRTEMGESNKPIVNVASPQSVTNNMNVLNFDGIADPETRNKALRAAAARMLEQQVEEVIEVEPEADHE